MSKYKSSAIAAAIATLALVMANDATPADKKAELQSQIDGLEALDAENADNAAAATEAQEVIGDLKEQLKGVIAKKAVDSKKPVVEIDGEKYEVNCGAHGVGSAAEVAKNEEACKRILKKEGQTILTKI